MKAAKYSIMGSDYLGVFATATDNYAFVGAGLTANSKNVLSSNLEVESIDVSIFGSDLVGIFIRGNSNGIIVSNLILEEELDELKKEAKGVNVCVLDSDLNAIGSNILANDKVAIINPDYSTADERKIADYLGVEAIRTGINGFKTVGANNILTNKGLVINNKGTEKEKAEWDRISGFDSIRSTANMGSLAIGLSVIANSKAVVAGDTTTGFELARITEALE